MTVRLRLVCYSAGTAAQASSRLRSYYPVGALPETIEISREVSFLSGLRGDVLHLQKVFSLKTGVLAFIYRITRRRVLLDVDDLIVPYHQGRIGFLLYLWTTLFASQVIVDTTARRKYWQKSGFRWKCISIIPDVLDVPPDVGNVTIVGDAVSFGWIGHASNLLSIETILKDSFYQQHGLTVVTNGDAVEMLRAKYPDVHFLAWYDGIVFKIPYVRFIVLNHALDKESLLKSDNKMALAFAAGKLPLVSATPSYRKLAEKVGAPEIVFQRFEDIPDIIGKLSDARVQEIVANGKAYVEHAYSPASVAEMLMQAIQGDILSQLAQTGPIAVSNDAHGY